MIPPPGRELFSTVSGFRRIGGVIRIESSRISSADACDVEGSLSMLHYSCDLCGKELLVEEDLRYVAKIEVYAAYDPLEITEEDLDEDHMEEISELLKNMEHMDEQELEDQVYKSFRFDLCPECQKKFLKDPLSREANRSIDFSKN
jgi:hypothetical protein